MCFTLWNICLCVCVLVHRVRGFQKRWVKLDVDYLSYFDNDKVTTSMYSNTNTFTLITFNRDLHQKRDASSMPVLLKHPVCNGIMFTNVLTPIRPSHSRLQISGTPLKECFFSDVAQKCTWTQVMNGLEFGVQRLL